MLSLSQLYIVALLCVASLLLFIVNIAWRRRPGPGVTSFIWLMLACTVWTLGYALQLSSSTLTAKLLWLKIGVIGPATVATFGVLFLLNFSGRTSWLRWPYILALAVVPTLTILLTWTNEVHSLVYQDPRLVLRGSFLLLVFERGPWFWFILLYSNALLLVTGALIVDLASSLPILYRRQVAAIVVSFAVPWASNLIYVSTSTSRLLPDFTPLSFAVTGVVLWWALLRYRFLTATPAAHDAILEHMRDMVLVVDEDHRILDLNEPAATFAGAPKTRLIGTSITHIFPTWPDLIAGNNAANEEGDEITASVRSGTQYFDLHSVPVATQDSRHTARLIVARDITDRQKHERQLAILNDITRVALQTTDVQTTVHTLAARLQALFDTDTCYLFLYDQEEEALSPAIQLGESSADKMIITSIANSVLDEERALVQHIDKPHRAPAAVLGMPMLGGGVPLGAAVIRRESPADFTDSEIIFGEQAVQQAALGIARLQALDTAQQRASELDALYQATNALFTTLNLSTLLQRALDAAIDAIPPAERGMLLLLDESNEYLRVRAARGYMNPHISAIEFPPNHRYTTDALCKGESLLISKGSSDEHLGYNGEIAEMRQIRSAIVAPLILGEEPIGIISLDSRRTSAFTEANLRLLKTFATTATAAIQNATLHAEMQELATTDTLTNLLNRHGFFELGRREVDRSHRFDRKLSAVMFDIDHFKQVNDEYGHTVGDQILAALAQRCRSELRAVDLLGRYGGEEFVALLIETGQTRAHSVAERLRLVISEAPFDTSAGSIAITVSLGVAELGEACSTLRRLIDCADKALYAAKKAGRNRVVSHRSRDVS